MHVSMTLGLECQSALKCLLLHEGHDLDGPSASLTLRLDTLEQAHLLPDLLKFLLCVHCKVLLELLDGR